MLSRKKLLGCGRRHGPVHVRALRMGSSWISRYGLEKVRVWPVHNREWPTCISGARPPIRTSVGTGITGVQSATMIRGLRRTHGWPAAMGILREMGMTHHRSGFKSFPLTCPAAARRAPRRLARSHASSRSAAAVTAAVGRGHPCPEISTCPREAHSGRIDRQLLEQ